MRGRARWGLRRPRPSLERRSTRPRAAARSYNDEETPLPSEVTPSVLVLELRVKAIRFSRLRLRVNGPSIPVFGDPYADGRSAHNEWYRTACAGNSGGAAASAPTEVRVREFLPHPQQVAHGQGVRTRAAGDLCRGAGSG